MLNCHVRVLDASHHPGKLTQSLVAADRDHPAGRDVLTVGPAHDEMPVGVCRDLGQVGHHDHLRRGGQRGQPSTHIQRCLSAHAGIHLIKDKGGDIPASRDDLERQHDSRELATGGNLGDAAGRRSRVGCQQDLDIVNPVAAEPHRRGALTECEPVRVGTAAKTDLHHGLAHGQMGKLLADPAAKVRCGTVSGRAQLTSAATQLISKGLEPDLQPVGSVIGPLKLGEPGRGVLGPDQDLIRGVAILALQPGQVRPPALDPGQPGRVDIDIRQVYRQVDPQVGAQVAQLLQATIKVGQRLIVTCHRCQRGSRRAQQVRHVTVRSVVAETANADSITAEPITAEPIAAAARVDAFPVAGQKRMSHAGAGPQTIGMRQSLILGAQLKILTRPRVDRLDLLKAGSQHIYLPRPVASQSAQVAQLGTNPVKIVVQRGVPAKWSGDGLASEPVQHDAMLLRLTQPPLVRLAMHGHEQLAELPQHADRHGPATDMSF